MYVADALSKEYQTESDLQPPASDPSVGAAAAVVAKSKALIAEVTTNPSTKQFTN